MAMTRAELIAQVIEDTGRSDKATPIIAYVNRAQTIIVKDASQMNWDFSCLKKEKYMATVDGTKIYTFPADSENGYMKSLYDLRLWGYYDSDEAKWVSGKAGKMTPLTPMYQDAVRPSPEGDSEGKPTKYIPWGTYFELSPIPDAIYRLYMRCLMYPADMATGDYSQLLYMDEVIIKCADWLTVLSLNLEKDIRRFKAEYQDLLRGAVRTDQREHAMDIQLHATPFVGGKVALEPEYWLKPSYLRGPK